MNNSSIYKLTLITNLLKIFFSTIISFISLPITLNYLGETNYAIWILLNSIANYFSLSLLGLESSSQILMNISQSFLEKIYYFKNAIKISALISLFVFFCFLIFNYIFSDWFLIFGIKPVTLSTLSQNTFIVILFFFMINLPFNIINSSFNGFQKVYISNIFAIFSSISLLFVVIISSYFNLNFFFLAVLTGLSNLLLNIFRWIYFRSKFLNNTPIFFGQSKQRNFKSKNLYTLGFYSLLALFSSLILNNVDILILNQFSNLYNIVPYSITTRLFFILFSIIFSINSTAIPIIGIEYSSFNFSRLNSLIQNTLTTTMLISSFLSLITISFFRTLIYVWLGSSFFIGLFTLLLFSVTLFINSLSNLFYIIINTLNYLKDSIPLIILEPIIKLILSILLFEYFSISGLIIATLLSNTLTIFMFFPRIIKIKSLSRITISLKSILKFTILYAVPFFSISFMINLLLDNYFLIILFATFNILFFIIIVYLFYIRNNLPFRDFLIRSLYPYLKQFQK